MNFTRFCRTCTTDIGEEYKGIYLFDENSQILELFTKCTSLKIDELDNLPAYICDECNRNIINFHQFRLTCEKSDIYFRENLLSSIEVKAEFPVIEEVKNETFGEKFVKFEINFVENKTLPTVKRSSSVYNSTFECAICGKILKKKRTLKYHLLRHCELKAFQCDLCDQNFGTLDHLLNHKQEHHDDGSRQFQCTQCGKSYRHSKSLCDHVKSSHLNIKRNYKSNERETRYTCIHCGKKYKKKESLDGHIRQHQGLDPFECKLCGTTFQKWRSLRLHNDAKHNDDFQKIPCDYDGCDKAFTTKFGLKEHISNIHLGIKKPKTTSQISYVCELCGKSFKNKTSLKKHSYCHTGERPFACTYCPKRFTVKDKLKNHIMRHENIKNFECNYCGMRKVTMAELKIHMNSHTMDKVYPCSQCSAVFSRDGNAKRHFRIVHRGYKPYKCTTCSQSFSKKETLRHHEMRHSGEKPHACSICDKRFIQPIALKKHLKVHNKQTLTGERSCTNTKQDVTNSTK